MGYYIDLSQISLSNFKERILKADLLPSQKILLDNIDKNFDSIKEKNISNMDELQQVLKSKKKVQNFSEISGIPVDYLTILRREVNSYHPKPNNIKNFPGVSETAIKTLEKLGIKHTLHLFEKIISKENRTILYHETGISIDELEDLAHLTDLSRIKWVGPIFARMLIAAGYDTAEKVAQADYVEFHKKLEQINEGYKYFKGKLGLNDMKLCVRVAKDVPQAIEF